MEETLSEQEILFALFDLYKEGPVTNVNRLRAELPHLRNADLHLRVLQNRGLVRYRSDNPDRDDLTITLNGILEIDSDFVETTFRNIIEQLGEHGGAASITEILYTMPDQFYIASDFAEDLVSSGMIKIIYSDPESNALAASLTEFGEEEFFHCDSVQPFLTEYAILRQ